MRYLADIMSYVNDEKFSNGLDISFKELGPARTRIEKILDICRGKKVIHMGCADHLPLIKQKILNNRWLHLLLTEQTERCIGIDNNAESISYIQNELKMLNVYCSDIESDEINYIKETDWDYLILGEIIEHVDNPVKFLERIHELFKGKVKSIIITAPNVLNIQTIKDIKNNSENINTNHNYWFSPYTLTRVTHRSGFINIEFSFVERVALPFHLKMLNRAKQAVGIQHKFSGKYFSSILIMADF